MSVAAETAVVTGAAGWLGQNLVRALAPDRTLVRCLVQDPEEAPLLELVGPSVQVVVGDVRDPSVMDELFAGTRGATVFHAAGVIHPPKTTRTFFDVNVGGTQLALDQARRAGAGRFVHISSNSPYGANERPTDRFTEASPQNPYLAYGRSKAEGEDLVRRTSDRGDLEAVILRPPWFLRAVPAAAPGPVLHGRAQGPLPAGGRRSPAAVDGLHRQPRAGLPARRDGRCRGRPGLLDCRRRALRAAPDLLGRAPGARRRGPRGQAGVGSCACRASAPMWPPGPTPACRRWIATSSPCTCSASCADTIACDISKARAELGYDPQVGLVEGMRASIRWCLERGIAL